MKTFNFTRTACTRQLQASKSCFSFFYIYERSWNISSISSSRRIEHVTNKYEEDRNHRQKCKAMQLRRNDFPCWGQTGAAAMWFNCFIYLFSDIDSLSLVEMSKNDFMVPNKLLCKFLSCLAVYSGCKIKPFFLPKRCFSVFYWIRPPWKIIDLGTILSTISNYFFRNYIFLFIYLSLASLCNEHRNEKNYVVRLEISSRRNCKVDVPLVLFNRF